MIGAVMRGMDRMVFSSIVFWLGLVLIPVAVLIPDVLVTVYVIPAVAGAATGSARRVGDGPRLTACGAQRGARHRRQRHAARGRLRGRAADAHAVQRVVHALGGAATATAGSPGGQGAPAAGGARAPPRAPSAVDALGAVRETAGAQPTRGRALARALTRNPDVIVRARLGPPLSSMRTRPVPFASAPRWRDLGRRLRPAALPYVKFNERL